MMTYLITGATGFLGRYVAAMIEKTGAVIYALARDLSSAQVINPNLRWIEGDLANLDLISDDKERERIRTEVTHIIHLAALYDIEASTDELFLANVAGTHNVLFFASLCPNLKALHYASTMAVAGDYQHEFSESMFAEGQRFPNAYAWTKYTAEASVRGFEERVPRFIYRLGILVGDSQTGHIPKSDGPYYLINALARFAKGAKLINQLRFVGLPFDELVRLYFVPVDNAAENLVRGILGADKLPHEPFRVYHLMGQEGGIPIRSVLKKILLSLGVKAHLLPIPRNPLMPLAARWLGVPEATLFYMYSRCQFATDLFRRDFPDAVILRFEDYADAFLTHAPPLAGGSR